jgi:hypothetical protein
MKHSDISSGDPVGSAPGEQPIEMTWATTSPGLEQRERIGKVWAAQGKWPVTSGVKRTHFWFERAAYPDLASLASDLKSRVTAGTSVKIVGELLTHLDPAQSHHRTSANFSDAPHWAFEIDFDGLDPDEGGPPLDGPEAFGDVVVCTARARLPKALGSADCVLYATSSTGLPVNARGEPANGRARFRLVFQLSKPLRFANQSRIAAALKMLPGLNCIDIGLYGVPDFVFVARPEFPKGMTDPVANPVIHCKDESAYVDVDALERDLSFHLIEADWQRRTNSGMEGPENRLLQVDPNIRFDLVERLVAAIPNDIDKRDGWVAVAHAINGACGNREAGRPIWLEFCDRWTEVGDFDEDERVWETLGEGKAGIGHLIRLALKAGTPEALAAVEAIREAQGAWRQANAAKCFPDLPAEEIASNEAVAEARDRWSKLRTALQWPGKNKLMRKTNAIAWREPGIAVFGCGAATGNAAERRWVSDRHARGYVSVTNGSPAAGKTFLAVTYANAIAAEKPALAGLDRIERAGAVVIVAADGERAEEFQRKDQAFREYYNLTNDDFRHPIYVFENVGPFVEKRGDVWAPSLWLLDVAPNLAEIREREKLALVVVDTLLGVSGGGNTADTTDMQALMDTAKILSTQLDCAVDILNHLTKSGAKSDLSNMDAGLGARPLTATPRFVANLKKEGALVRIAMAKASYMGGPKGASAFKFQSIHVTVDVDDVDGSIVATETRSLGVLVPSSEAALRRAEEADAHKALCEAHEKNVEIKRGSRMGKRSADHASLIVQTALGLGTHEKARKKADALVEALVDQGFVKLPHELGQFRLLSRLDRREAELISVRVHHHDIATAAAAVGGARFVRVTAARVSSSASRQAVVERPGPQRKPIEFLEPEELI